MTKTLIDVDTDLLDRARDILGVATKKDGVNGALRELVRMAGVREFVTAVAGIDLDPPGDGLVLVDASVLVHCAEPAVAARLVPLLVLDRVATCAAVEHEVAGLVGAGLNGAPLAVFRRAGLRWLATEDADLRRAAEIQAELTSRGDGRLPWSRLVIAAVAERHQTTILHQDPDFVLIAKVTGQSIEWVVPEGTVG